MPRELNNHRSRSTERLLAALFLWFSACHVAALLLAPAYHRDKTAFMLAWGSLAGLAALAATACPRRALTILAAALFLVGSGWPTIIGLPIVAASWLNNGWAHALTVHLRALERHFCPATLLIFALTTSRSPTHASPLLRLGRLLFPATALLLFADGFHLYPLLVGLGMQPGTIRYASPLRLLLQGYCGSATDIALIVVLLFATWRCRPAARWFRIPLSALVLLSVVGVYARVRSALVSGYPAHNVGIAFHEVLAGTLATAAVAVMLLVKGNAYASDPANPLCPQCGYSLIGRVSPYCPECGRTLPPPAQTST